MIMDDNRDSAAKRTFSATARLLSALKLDGPLLVSLGLLALYALIVQYSASGQSLDTVMRTLMRLGLGTMAMIALAHSGPNFLRSLAPWLYGAGIALLLVVDAIGYVGKGAQRWLDLGLIRFQPSEIMKLAVPMMAAAFMHERPLPPA
jgi:rod shape determining protein RodA